ncbi:MAG TPA: S1/P1 nuclease [Candidatus Limnocylindrales bacterium]|nr:S1/P1 nuclease [Candidatus Limnocylindrales bacterium]
MIRKPGIILFLTSVLCMSQPEGFGWDYTTHMVIAQIAYNRLNNKARERLDALVQKIKFHEKTYTFITAACWLDDLRDDPAYEALKTWHFINKPYFDGVPPREIPLPSDPILSHLRSSIENLRIGTGSEEKDAEALGVLLHLVGDAHQPLHCINRYSEKNNDEEGDRGGNEFKIITDIEGVNNLHRYWDGAAGLFKFETIQRPLSQEDQQRIQKYADEILSAYPPDAHKEWKEMDPDRWIEESYQIARTMVYKTPEGERLTEDYTFQSQRVARERIALAGYRLAELLNMLFGN